ncbi:transcriptional regulator [Marinicella sediminis]|uniref:Transcriptional regulator n=1 Tax=Marinicella sediminis TaxID=1792834 RepID=A0ABV7JEQ9_9GAMM|nr:winged helix-turn-helix domain-containing protein [Marinicella sediminis]
MHYKIQDCLINTHNRTLNKNGNIIPLTPKLFRLLMLFIESGDQLVSKSSIRKHVWQGQLVCETTLYKTVQRLRVLLGDDGEGQTVIRTIHGEGYMMLTRYRKAGWWFQLYQKWLTRQASSAPI